MVVVVDAVRHVAAQRLFAVRKERGHALVVGRAAVVAALGHAVVAEHKQQRVVGQPLNRLGKHLVELAELVAHLDVPRAKAVADVVDAEKVANQHVPVGAVELAH